MLAGWMRRRASLTAMRRISCSDQQISGGERCSSSCAFFLGASRCLRYTEWRPSWRATGDERARLWGKSLEFWPPYADYQRKTTREIPVVVLDPMA